MITSTVFVSNNDGTAFAKAVSEAIQKLQGDQYTDHVEIQYQPVNDSMGNVVWSALLIGRQA